jgi:hypothetical protein
MPFVTADTAEPAISDGVEYFHGSVTPLAIGATIGPPAWTYSEIDRILDAGRVRAPLKAGSVSAAPSIKDATAIAAIRLYARAQPAPQGSIRVYEVKLEPSHAAPIALYEELRIRMLAGASLAPLIREYWLPTGIWQLKEILAPNFTIVRETPPPTERETYVRRWVHYNQDRARARAL